MIQVGFFFLPTNDASFCIENHSGLFMMVSLALLKLHCVSKIMSSHLCLQSIPHLDTLHTAALPANAYATNSISQDGSIVLQWPLGPSHFLQVIQCIALFYFSQALFLL